MKDHPSQGQVRVGHHASIYERKPSVGRGAAPHAQGPALAWCGAEHERDAAAAGVQRELHGQCGGEAHEQQLGLPHTRSRQETSSQHGVADEQDSVRRLHWPYGHGAAAAAPPLLLFRLVVLADTLPQLLRVALSILAEQAIVGGFRRWRQLHEPLVEHVPQLER